MDDAGSRVVGRDAELATCDAALRAGACPLVVISGEAGIGKTTVWEAALALARAQGFRTLVARPAGSESALAYSALNDLLAGCVDGLLPQLPPARARMLRVALLLEEPGHIPVRSRGVAFALLDALRLLVRRGDMPLVAVDDAQWLDPASATALGFALRRLGGEGGLAGLLSCRTERGAEAEQPLTADRPLRIELGPLSAGALFRIIRERLGRSVPVPLLAKIHQASGGNPFYALELARRSLEVGSLSMPESVAALARERLAGFPGPTVEAADGNPWARATGLRCRGLIAAARRQPEAAVAALQQAAQAHGRSQDPFEHARTLLALGNALRRGNQRRAAREELGQARGIFARLGAPVWEERAVRDLASVSGRPPADTGLTVTERRVAELVARGGTNREVAARLVVSERTVATHLTHIYAKLGLRSRTELARTLPASGPKIRASDDVTGPQPA